MKRFLSVLVALLFVGGLATAAGAATLSFQIDFGQDGTFETGTIYDILPGTSVMADLYFTVTEEGVIGGGLSMQYDLAQSDALADAFYSPFSDTGSSYNNPGDLGLQFFVFPPGVATEPGQHKLAQFEFVCFGPGDIYPLMIYDFGVTDDWVTETGLVLDDQLVGGIELARINQVPIPGAVWLLGSGLLGMLGLARRRKS